MSDDLTRYLLSDRQSQVKISPEMLELMGKQAANRFLEDGVALNESIAKLAGAYPDVGVEQVKRICEFANNAVYLGLHDKSKTAGAETSYPQFALADAGRVVQDLSDGARPTKVSPIDVAYGRLLERTKLASATTDDLLSDLFAFKKEASKESREKVLGDMVDTKNDLSSLKGVLENAAQELDALHKEASDEYYSEVKSHILEGGSFTDVLAAAQTSGMAYEKTAELLMPFVSKLLKEKVASPVALKAATSNLEKVAHRVVNEKHPLVAGFFEIAAIDAEIKKMATGLAEVDVELGRVNKFLKQQVAG
jgi:hypothetical protein